MDFKIQLLKTFGYGRRLSLFHLHKPQLPGYLILKSGKKVGIYRPDRA
jgi:adenylate cyclase